MEDRHRRSFGVITGRTNIRSRIAPRAPGRRGGFTLLEMVTSMALMVIVLGGMTSAVVVASRAIDDGTDPGVLTAEAAGVLTEISAEINFARQFDELTVSSVAFRVPDRDGDGRPEKIRYAWSQVAGEPLTREYNGGPAVNIVDKVNRFALTSLVRSITPPPQACCMPDATCREATMEVCAAAEGEAMGKGTDCTQVTCPRHGSVLFILADPAIAIPEGPPEFIPSGQEAARIALIEAWGFSVTLISALDTQASFDTAIADVDAAYVSMEVNAADLGSKIAGTGAGVVNENPQLIGTFGFASGQVVAVTTLTCAIINNTHYITLPFSTGTLTLVDAVQQFVFADSGVAAGARVLATIFSSKDSLIVLDTGDALVGGAPAPGRRVQLPWGNTGFDATTLSTDGQTMMRRAVEWAAGFDSGVPVATVCGDNRCEAPEGPCDCPDDCGAPDASEQPGVTCTDGLDNDCDGMTDCADINCVLLEFGCTCGNVVCSTGEDCHNCPGDCKGVATGTKAENHCCGNGILETAEADGTICDFNP